MYAAYCLLLTPHFLFFTLYHSFPESVSENPKSSGNLHKMFSESFLSETAS